MDPLNPAPRKNPLFQKPAFSRNLSVAETLRAVGRPHGLTPSGVALAWVLSRPGVTGAIAGARRPGQLGDLAAAADARLSADDPARIEGAFSGA